MRIALALTLLLLLLPACADGGDPTTGETAVGQLPTLEELLGTDPTPTPSPLGNDGLDLQGEAFTVRVIGERGHDESAFSQGLELHDGRMYESRGLYGQSAVTEIDPQTGEVLRSEALGEEFFGEGLTVLDDRVIQITWQEQTAYVYDVETFVVEDTFTYTGEGWGICDGQDGGVLYMSNGTATLTHRDPDDFSVRDTVTVTLDGEPVRRLNELECVPGADLVLANVWQTSTILLIDPATGVAREVDASAIATADGRWAEDPDRGDVLNGIAWDPTEEVWLLTGKLWPVTYEVAIDCVEGCVEQAAVRPFYVRRAS